MFQAQNREAVNSTWKVAVSFEIIMTTSITKPCFTTQYQTCKTTACKTKTDFWSQTGLVLRPTVSDHITGNSFGFCRPILFTVLKHKRYSFEKPGDWFIGRWLQLWFDCRFTAACDRQGALSALWTVFSSHLFWSRCKTGLAVSHRTVCAHVGLKFFWDSGSPRLGMSVRAYVANPIQTRPFPPHVCSSSSVVFCGTGTAGFWHLAYVSIAQLPVWVQHSYHHLPNVWIIWNFGVCDST